MRAHLLALRGGERSERLRGDMVEHLDLGVEVVEVEGEAEQGALRLGKG